ncbi:hypothetical protein [Kutzneria sp. NPDC051319]
MGFRPTAWATSHLTMLERHHSHIREHFEDMPEIQDWIWTR